MRYILHLLFILFILTSISCEKVIDIDLNEGAKKYVIEGIVTDQAGMTMVLISQTKNFDENNNFLGISGATVTITEAGGATTTLNETSTGMYEAPSLVGVSGKTYSLSVTIAGQSFNAVCRMPQKVNLDTIYVTNEILFGETRKIVNTIFNDPPGLGNSWRFVQHVNGRKEPQVMIRDDEYSDGRRIANQLFYFTDDNDDVEDEIESGDEVIIDMLNIDPVIYKYWWSLFRSSTNIGGQGQATPSNPVSNMQGGALGYFSAHTIQTKIITVP